MALAAALNRSFASPVSNFDYPGARKTGSEGLLLRFYDGISGFSVLVTLLLVLVAYDQCEQHQRQISSSTVADPSIVKYLWNKGSIVGPTWKAPFFGPFLSSVYPKMDEYKAKWASGDLSCVSVFHKYGRHPPIICGFELMPMSQVRRHCLVARDGPKSLQLTSIR